MTRPTCDFSLGSHALPSHELTKETAMKKSITVQLLNDAIQRWPDRGEELGLCKAKVVRRKITNVMKQFSRTHHDDLRNKKGLPAFINVLDVSPPKIDTTLHSAMSPHNNPDDKSAFTLTKDGSVTEEWRIMRGIISHEIADLYTRVWRERIKRLQREPYQPVKEALDEVLRHARVEAGNTLTWRPVFHHRRFEEDLYATNHDGIRTYALTATWLRMTKKLQKASVGDRFILSAKLVDEVGVIDLYQITFLDGQNRDVQHGFLGKYKHDSIRGFGVKPETALQWTKRQIIMSANKKIGLL